MRAEADGETSDAADAALPTTHRCTLRCLISNRCATAAPSDLPRCVVKTKNSSCERLYGKVDYFSLLRFPKTVDHELSMCLSSV